MPIQDRFHDYAPGLTGPIIGGFDITPDDGSDLSELPRALMVSGAGDVAVEFVNGTSMTLPGLQVGVIYAIRPQRVRASGTTATGIKGLY